MTILWAVRPSNLIDDEITTTKNTKLTKRFYYKSVFVIFVVFMVLVQMEVEMWSIGKKSAVLAVAFVAFSAVSARASSMEFKAPFPFLVKGETLPAGQYLIENNGSGVMSIRGERNNEVNMFVMTLPAKAHDPAGEKPAVTFKRGENMWKLSNVWTSPDDGRAIVGG